MKAVVSNRSYHLNFGKEMAMETITVLQLVTKVYLMELIFRKFDYYTKMRKFLPAK